MNKIPATIKHIYSQQNVAFIKLESCGVYKQELNALLLDFDKRMQIGLKCNAVFKESEVLVSRSPLLSARNQIIASIDNIKQDEIFARIFFGKNLFGFSLTSLITKEARESLGLKIGEEVIFCIKSNEIMLEF